MLEQFDKGLDWGIFVWGIVAGFSAGAVLSIALCKIATGIFEFVFNFLKAFYIIIKGAFDGDDTH